MSVLRIADNVKKLIDSFAAVTGCGITALRDGDVICNRGSCAMCCPSTRGDDCVRVHTHAATQAQRFGGRYIYFCPAGFIFAASPAFDDDGVISLCAGPMMATEREDFIPTDLHEPFNSDADSSPLNDFIATLPVIPPDSVTAISDILCAVAGYIGGEVYNRQVGRGERLEQQRQINDYIQSVKARLILGKDSFTPYPYDKEKQLVYAISSGNKTDARRYLNEILGHIFFASANNLEAIKIRAMELTVLISRAALDAGADMNSIYQYNLQFMSDFYKLDTIEDVCFALTEILRRFTDETFRFADVKHVDLLSKAVSYMRENYMHKITLDDVAEHIYLSPSYLSKIFKEEMKTSFNSYLNTVRIEKSKILLLSEQLSVSEVSELVGFFDQSYFNKVFKRITGVTPKRFREQKRGEIRQE